MLTLCGYLLGVVLWSEFAVPAAAAYFCYVCLPATLEKYNEWHFTLPSLGCNEASHQVTPAKLSATDASSCPQRLFTASFTVSTCSIIKEVAVQIFKWEKRKGWDVLLSAFLTQFTSSDNVVLYMKTTSFLSDSKFGDHMQQWASDHLQLSGSVHMEDLPSVYVIDENMSQEKLRSLYASVDCFVLPSRLVILIWCSCLTAK